MSRSLNICAKIQLVRVVVILTRVVIEVGHVEFLLTEAGSKGNTRDWVGVAWGYCGGWVKV